MKNLAHRAQQNFFFAVLSVTVLSSLVSTFFLYSLQAATLFRQDHPALIFLLPLAGALVGSFYASRLGAPVEAGTQLVIEEIHRPLKALPRRMTLSIFVTSVITHLFGGSAGREGTAVQMGASIADTIARFFSKEGDDRRTLLLCGLGTGFASVFGTPWAALVFALEIVGWHRSEFRRQSRQMVSRFAWVAGASLLSSQLPIFLGIHRESISITELPELSWILPLKLILLGLGCGLVALSFLEILGFIAKASRKISKLLPVRAAIGGLTLVALILFLGPTGRRFLGLSDGLIEAAFLTPLPATDWLWKNLLTALTLGTGFKGGEVTPLFCIGSTFGNALSPWLGLPLAFAAALGFVSVFAGAGQIAITCGVLAWELFGWKVALCALATALLSQFVCGWRHAGLYSGEKH